MALLSTLLDRVHDELPAVPEPVALRFLSDSFKEFCTRTHAWQEELPAVRVRAERTQFELSPDTGTMVAAIKEVRLESGELVPAAPAELSRILTTRPSTSAKPLAWFQTRPDIFEVVNASEEDVRLSVLAALTLVQSYTEYDLPEILLSEWGENIAAGAKGRLLVQPNQPWSAPELAPEFRRQFYVAVNQAKARAMTSLGAAQLQVQMRSW